MRHDQLLHLQISGKIDTLHFDSQTLKGKKIANSSSSLLPFLHPLCVMHQFYTLIRKSSQWSIVYSACVMNGTVHFHINRTK